MSVGKRAEVHGAFSFVVQIDDIQEAVFTECTLPTLEVEVEEEKEGGYNDGTHLLPKRVKRGNLTLKRGLASGSTLLRWYMDVLQGDLSKTRRQVSVTLYDSQGTAVMRWDLSNAYPTKWTGPTLNAGNSSVAVETLELAYESLTVT